MARQLMLIDQNLGCFGDRDNAVCAIQQHPLWPPGKVVQPPNQSDWPRQISRWCAVAVIDQVVNSQNQPVTAPPGTHSLHRAEHHVWVQPVDRARHEWFTDACWRAHDLPGQCGQQVKLAVVADEHRDRMQLAQLGD